MKEIAIPYCDDCNVSISTKTDRCPLCQKQLEDADTSAAVKTFPDYVYKRKRASKLAKAVALISILSIALSIVGNILTWNGHPWSIIISACVLYVWLMGSLTFKKGAHLGLKLMMHALALSLLLVIINTFASQTVTIHRVSWAVSYAIPILFICFIIAINILIFRRRQNRRDYFLYQLSLCIIGFIPLILVLFGVAQPILPSVIAAGLSLLTILESVVFAKKLIGRELGRKFHTK